MNDIMNAFIKKKTVNTNAFIFLANVLNTEKSGPDNILTVG